jgi:hypothetical protein
MRSATTAQAGASDEPTRIVDLEAVLAARASKHAPKPLERTHPIATPLEGARRAALRDLCHALAAEYALNTPTSVPAWTDDAEEYAWVGTHEIQCLP